MARIAVVGDVHGERVALERLLVRIERHGVERVIALGDVLDRGPDSLGALRLVRRHRFRARDGSCRRIELITGNHEANYCHHFFKRPLRFRDGSMGVPRPTSPAIAAGLTADEYEWLDSLPRFLRIKERGLDLLLLHGGISPQHARIPGWLGPARQDQLTRIGCLDETTGEPLHPARSSRIHWAHTYRQHHGPRIVFGHVSWPHITRFENAVGVDCSKYGRVAGLIISSENEAEIELYEEIAV